MKRIFSVVLIALFLLGLVSTGYAISDYQSRNAEILGGHDADGTSPVTLIVRVRYGRGCQKATGGSEGNWSGLSSGDAVVWDTTSADGVTVSAAVTTSATPGFAGVLVTTLATADSAASKMVANSGNWGYMAIKGYCLAKVITASATAGQALCLMGTTSSGALGTADKAAASATVSEDIGVLLQNTGSNGLMPVWLK